MSVDLSVRRAFWSGRQNPSSGVLHFFGVSWPVRSQRGLAEGFRLRGRGE
jgi:hypothetical protein